MTIGERIKEARKQKGMTQKQVADKCGMADSNLRAYELGKAKPKIETLQRIADALETHIGHLMGTETPDNADITWLSSKLESIPLEELDQAMAEFIKDSAERFEHISINTLSDALWRAFGPLNKKGKVEAVRRVQELSELRKYTEPDKSKDFRGYPRKSK